MSSSKQRPPRPPTNALTVVFFIGAVFFVLAFGGRALEGYRLHRYNATLRAEIGALKEQQERLRERLEYVQTSAYVEEVAREQYKWTSDGKTLVIPILKQDPAAAVSPTPSAHAAASAHDKPPSCCWPLWQALLAPFD